MDRLADLKTDDPTGGADDTAAPADVELGTSTDGAPGELGTELAKYEPLIAATKSLQKHTALANKLREEQMKVASEQDKAVIQRRMNQITSEATAAGLQMKKLLGDLKKANDEYAAQNPGSSVAMMRKNLLSKHHHAYASSVREFELASGAYKKSLEEDVKRNLRQRTNLDEKKIDEIVASGQAQAVLQATISDDLADVIDSIQQRHASILALERSVREVQELFIDLAHIVEEQQETLNTIEGHIAKTIDYVQKGEVNLTDAEKDQTAARKRQCCIIVIVVSVLFVVVGVPVLKAVS